MARLSAIEERFPQKGEIELPEDHKDEIRTQRSVGVREESGLESCMLSTRFIVRDKRRTYTFGAHVTQKCPMALGLREWGRVRLARCKGRTGRI